MVEQRFGELCVVGSIPTLIVLVSLIKGNLSIGWVPLIFYVLNYINMKKIILLTFAIILATSCSYRKINGIQLNKGDTKTYETKDYLIIYEVKGFSNFGQPLWEFKEIINKKDSL